MARILILLGVIIFYIVGWFGWGSKSPSDMQTYFLVSTGLGILFWASCLWERKNMAILTGILAVCRFGFLTFGFGSKSTAEIAFYWLVAETVTLFPVYLVKDDWIQAAKEKAMEKKSIKVIGTFDRFGLYPFKSTNQEYFAAVTVGFPDQEGYEGTSENVSAILAKSNMSTYRLLATGSTAEDAITALEEREFSSRPFELR